VCQEGWDGAHAVIHSAQQEQAFSQQSSGAAASSQSPPQPQLRYQQEQGASLGGPIMSQIGGRRLGRPVYGPYPSFWSQ